MACPVTSAASRKDTHGNSPDPSTWRSADPGSSELRKPPVAANRARLVSSRSAATPLPLHAGNSATPAGLQRVSLRFGTPPGDAAELVRLAAESSESHLSDSAKLAVLVTAPRRRASCRQETFIPATLATETWILVRPADRRSHQSAGSGNSTGRDERRYGNAWPSIDAERHRDSHRRIDRPPRTCIAVLVRLHRVRHRRSDDPPASSRSRHRTPRTQKRPLLRSRNRPVARSSFHGAIGEESAPRRTAQGARLKRGLRLRISSDS